jgi:hypothetical protein
MSFRLFSRSRIAHQMNACIIFILVIPAPSSSKSDAQLRLNISSGTTAPELRHSPLMCVERRRGRGIFNGCTNREGRGPVAGFAHRISLDPCEKWDIYVSRYRGYQHVVHPIHYLWAPTSSSTIIMLKTHARELWSALTDVTPMTYLGHVMVYLIAWRMFVMLRMHYNSPVSFKNHPCGKYVDATNKYKEEHAYQAPIVHSWNMHFQFPLRSGRTAAHSRCIPRAQESHITSVFTRYVALIFS